MKLILLTISVVSLLSACTTGEQMSRLEPGMTRQQVVGILDRPKCSPQLWPIRAARVHASPDHWLVMGSLGFQRHSQRRPRCRIRARRGQGSDSPGHVYAVQRTESVAASYLSIPATTAAAVGQRASGGAANGATVVDESVRQLKGAGQVVTEHWRTMPEIRGRVMTFSHYGYD